MLGDNVNKKIALVAIMVTVAAIAGYLVVAYAQENSNNKTSTVTPTPPATWAPLKGHREMWRNGFKGPLMWSVEVSPEYNSTVISVLESNPEIAQLLGQGYYIAWIKPVVKAYISGSGDITLKATQAIVTLTNSTAIYVYSVDIVNSTVTLLAYHQVPSYSPSCKCPCG